MSRRGRGRGRIGSGELPVIAGASRLRASLTDEAQLIAHLTLIDASHLLARLMDDGGVSTAALTLEAPVVPDQDEDTTPGTRNYTVPEYDILDIELWGAGASGGENTVSFSTVGNYNSYSPAAAGNNGGNTTIGALSLNAKGGLAPTASAINVQQAGGVGQTPTGGDINTAGADGESNQNGGGSDRAGAGGSAPDGGAGGARITGSGNSDQGRNGNDGTGPGGGGSGDLCSVFSLSDGWHHNGAAGGASGSKLKKRYFRGDVGAPVPGDLLSYTIGTGGAAPNADPGATRSNLAGKGADGKARFTVYAVGGDILRKRTVITSGSGTHTPDANAVSMNVRAVGPGSGGQGGGTSGGTESSDTTGDTTFGAMTAEGANGTASTTKAAASGGDINTPGGLGEAAASSQASTGSVASGSGAASSFGPGGNRAGAGSAPGSGGAGGVVPSSGGLAGKGGHSGAYCEKLYTDAAVQPYTYNIGTKSSGGAAGAGTGAGAGAAGVDGQIVIEEYW